MKFDVKTINVLKSFSSINPSMLFVPGNELKTVGPSKSVVARAKVDQSFESRFAIYDLAKLLGVLSLFNSPEIEIGSTSMKIKENGREVEYVFADESTITAPGSKELNLTDFDVEFDLTEVILGDIQKALGVLSAPEIMISGDGKEIQIATFDAKNPSSHTYRISLGATDKIFKFPFKAENWRLIMQDYHVSMSRKGIAKFEGDSKVDMLYWITMEAKSISFSE